MRRAALLALAAISASCGGDKAADEVRVFAASSLTEVMQKIGADFEKETGVKVKLNLAASSTLAKQIVEGAPCDVFLSADQEWADYVEKAGFVVGGTRRNLLGNELLLLARELTLRDLDLSKIPQCGGALDAGEVSQEDWDYRTRRIIRDPSVRRIAMGDPSHVPAGKYARAALESIGMWAEAAPKVVPCESVRAALALLERGETDAGIVYRTDARAAYDRLPEGAFPILLYARLGGPPIRYPAMRIHPVTGSGNQFDRYLEGPGARWVFEAAGFRIAGKAE